MYSSSNSDGDRIITPINNMYYFEARKYRGKKHYTTAQGKKVGSSGFIRKTNKQKINSTNDISRKMTYGNLSTYNIFLSTTDQKSGILQRYCT